MTNQIDYPLTTSSQQTYPFAYVTEPSGAYGLKVTASPNYLPVKIAGDITPTRSGVKIPVRMAGSYFQYSNVSAGHDYDFSMDIKPVDIGILKYGTDPLTNPLSLQFVAVSQQAQGTGSLNTYYTFFTGSRFNSVSLSSTGRDLVNATCEVWCRDITLETQTSGLTTPTFPTFASITEQPLSNVDSGYKPFKLGATNYALQEFSITWNNNLIRVPMIGAEQGLVEQIVQGPIEISGSIKLPVGQSLTFETLAHDFPEAGSTASFIFKNANMVCNMTNWQTTSIDNPIPSMPSDVKSLTIPFTCTTASLGTVVV
jgi:Phage tail tube protein